MSEEETALWWARARADGPQRTEPGRASPAGMLRLTEPDVTSVWLLPDLPEGARPGVLEELGLDSAPVEHPADTARVLAACLRCCWTDPSGPAWPGARASKDAVASVFGGITGRDRKSSGKAVVGAARQLDTAGWLLWDEPGETLRLGPRVAAWEPAELSTLREVWRMLPAPETGEEKR